jgi:hypothetical protein
MTQTEIFKKVLPGWFAIVGELRDWIASSEEYLDRKTGLASKRVVLTFVVECVVRGGVPRGKDHAASQGQTGFGPS